MLAQCPNQAQRSYLCRSVDAVSLFYVLQMHLTVRHTVGVLNAGINRSARFVASVKTRLSQSARMQISGPEKRMVTSKNLYVVVHVKV